jgi:hypothetical protein
MVVQNWADVVAGTLQSLWFGIVSFLPNILGALVIFTLGLAAAASLGALVEKILDTLKLDQFLEKLGLKPHVERAGFHLHASRFFGQIVNWALVIAFLLAASDILGLSEFSSFLREAVLGYIPNIIKAVLIMLATVVLANFLKRLISGAVKSAKLHGANFLGTLTYWSIVVFGFLTVLVQLNVAPVVINSLLTGFIAMLALAGGLAFGLGGKGYAEHLMNKLREHTEGHH